MIAYCPWCGAVLFWMAVDFHTGRYIYRHPELGRPCQGQLDEFIVDIEWGQFVTPRSIKGRNAWKLILNIPNENKSFTQDIGSDTHKKTHHQRNHRQ